MSTRLTEELASPDRLHGPLLVLSVVLVVLGGVGAAAALGQWLEDKLGDAAARPGDPVPPLFALSCLAAFLGLVIYAAVVGAR